MQLSTETIELAKRIVLNREIREARMQAERRAEADRRVAEFNAQQRRLAGVGFVVIETATGRAVGDGSAMPYGFAKRVRDTRDTFSTGAFLIKRVG